MDLPFTSYPAGNELVPSSMTKNRASDLKTIIQSNSVITDSMGPWNYVRYIFITVTDLRSKPVIWDQNVGINLFVILFKPSLTVTKYGTSNYNY